MTLKCFCILLLMLPSACGSGDSEATDGGLATADANECASPEVRTVDVGDVELSVTSQGCGPTMVFLHGFPEMGSEWDAAREALSDTYHVVVPDQRGYNLSDVPANVTDYETPHLVADIAGLIDATTTEKVILVAHDWGGAVAWQVAAAHPDKIRGLAILNAPHPDVFAALLASDSEQRSASGYMNLFIDPGAEALLSNNDYSFLAGSFNGALSADQIATYKQGWARPGSLTGMLNWYRANLESGPVPKNTFGTNVNISVPTLVMWGMMDTALLAKNLDGLSTYVTDLTIKEFPNADHWLFHRETTAVMAEIRTFAEGLP